MEYFKYFLLYWKVCYMETQELHLTYIHLENYLEHLSGSINVCRKEE